MLYTQMWKILKEQNENITMDTGKNTPAILSYLISLLMELN